MKTQRLTQDERRAAAEKQVVLYSVTLNTDLYATNQELIEAVKKKGEGKLDALTLSYIDQILFEGCNDVSFYKRSKTVVDIVNLYGIDHDIKQVSKLLHDLDVYTPDPIVALYMYLQADEFREYSSSIIVPCLIEDSIMIGQNGRPLHVKSYLSDWDGELGLMECRDGRGDWSEWFYSSYNFNYAYPRRRRSR